MYKTAITVSLVPEAKGGPFVFWDGLEDAFRRASEMGFDGIEIFAPGPDAIEPDQLQRLVERYELPVAAVGTGAGMVKHGLSLADIDAGQREKAIGFIKQMIEFGAKYNAPAIIGSMQGRWGGDVSHEMALRFLGEALTELGQFAETHQVTLIYEPLNRYESNLINTMQMAVECLGSLPTRNVKILADLFHMNIEESCLAKAIECCGDHLGHVHLADSNRQAAGFGHTDFKAVYEALQKIGYQGYLSGEILPLPDSDSAARQMMNAVAELQAN